MKDLQSLTDGGEFDLSLENLSQDLLDVVQLTRKQLGWPEMPGLILIGHSLGGAVVTDLAMNARLGNAVLGYAVLDVVEGTFGRLQLHGKLEAK